MALRYGSSPRRPAPPTTGGQIVYAIGDIHGRADLLHQLLALIETDLALIGPASHATLVFVGDYVDRGQDSREVVDRIIRLQGEPRFEVRALKGNHEAALLDFMHDAASGATWAEYGGLQTLASYGVSPPMLRSPKGDWESVRRAFAEALPASHLAFLSGLKLTARYGDYIFVHAGVRPGVPLADQRERDLLWIREEFLQSPGPHEGVIVHGHTPETAPFMGRQRIGIDTGAYATGVLTAVRLHGAERNLIQADGRFASQGSADKSGHARRGISG